MRTRAVLGSILVSGAVLVVGWQAGAAVLASSPAISTPQASGGSRTVPTTPAPTSTTPGAATTPTPASPPVTAGATDGTFAGAVVRTRFGNVQVQVTIAGGAITDVTPLQLTNDDSRSVQISNRAAPILHDEVLKSQSANVSNVSGATYTTQGYLSSLQSALDQAGF